jgi:hypothetical protein
VTTPNKAGASVTTPNEADAWNGVVLDEERASHAFVTFAAGHPKFVF